MNSLYYQTTFEIMFCLTSAFTATLSRGLRACIVCVFCLSTLLVSAQPLLADAGFEESDAAKSPWRPFQHIGEKAYDFVRDKEVKFEGAQSLRITQRVPQEFGAVEQVVSRPKAGNYKASAMLRSRGTDRAGWGLKFILVKADGFEVVYDTPALLGDVDWVARSVRFSVPDGARALHVIATLNGNGSGWIDKLELSVVE